MLPPRGYLKSRVACFMCMLVGVILGLVPDALSQELPSVTALPVIPVSFNVHPGVVLRARVNPHGLETRCTFLIDGVVAHGGSILAGRGSSEVDVQIRALGLKAGVSHTAVVRVRNQLGTVDSEPVTFTTPPTPAGAPSITMLPSSDPTRMRIEVNPHGQAVNLDIYSDNDWGGRIGTVGGDMPVIVEHPLGSWTRPGVIYVEASYAAKPYGPTASGGLVSPSGTRFDFAQDSPYPVFSPQGIAPAVTIDRNYYDVAETGAMVHARVDTWGAETYIEFFFNGKSTGVRWVGASDKALFYAGELRPGTEYVVTCKAWSEFGSTTSNSLTIRTTGTPLPGNKPPIGSLPVLRLQPEDQSVTGTITSSDPEGKVVSVQGYTQGSAGSVAIDGWQVTYTPGPAFSGSDQFYVVLVDGEGATSSITGQVIAAGADDQAGSYDLVVRFNTDPPKPAGRLTLDKTAGGSFTGRLVIYGAEYSLRGSFNSEGVALLDLDRVGLPPMLVTLTTSSRVESERYLYVTIDAAELAAVYVAEGAPIGNTETNAEVAGLQYTAILPMRAAEIETPQGDGFLTGRISKRGQARFVGQTGDGQPFSVGGRLQRTRKLQIGISVGKNPRDYLQGHLEFSKDANKTVRGDLAWLSYRTTTEHYRKNFTRALQPMGARYQAKLGLFGEVGGNDTAKVQLIGDDAVAIDSRSINLKAKRTTFNAKDSEVAIKVDRRSGVFRGTFTAGGSKRRFSGAVVQPFDRGAGTLNLGGPIGAVEVLPP